MCRALNWADEEAERLTDDDYHRGGGYDDEDDEDDDMDDGQGSRGAPSQDYREVGQVGPFPCAWKREAVTCYSLPTSQSSTQCRGRAVANDRLRRCRP